MVVEVSKKTTPKEFERIFKELSSKKKLDLKKYSNILSKEIDGLKFQKEARNEWE